MKNGCLKIISLIAETNATSCNITTHFKMLSEEKDKVMLKLRKNEPMFQNVRGCRKEKDCSEYLFKYGSMLGLSSHC